MTSWQRPVRAGVALIGIATAVTLYFALGERRTAGKPDGAGRLPKEVALRTTGKSSLAFLEGISKTLVVQAEDITVFTDGTKTLINVTIEPRERDGRHFVIRAAEARVGKDNRDFEFVGTVRLTEQDGFELATDHARFDHESGIVRAAGRVSFRKGAMHGTGTGMTYDQKGNILTIADRAQVDVIAQGTQPAISFTASAATLDRAQHRLTLDRQVHITRGEQITKTARAIAHLTADEERITFVELRGDASVTGGLGKLSALRAHEIDLDYADDGETIERIAQRGAAVIALEGENGAPGRRVEGETLNVQLRADRSLERMTGGGGVVMTLPAAEGGASKTIAGRSFEASGAPDGALRDARFVDQVVFSERSTDGMREARSRVLTLEMSKEALTRARFTDEATFTHNDLRARAAEADYRPSAGRLLLRGRDALGEPDMADDSVTVSAEEIDIGLEARQIEARGRVKTSIRSKARAAGSADKENGDRLPGLLQQDQPVSITADRLSYHGEAGTAVYSGRAVLSQADTFIRAATIDLQRKAGNLSASGSAQSRLLLGTEPSTGEADEIRYVDADRTVTYMRANHEGATLAHVNGPQGDLRGRRIQVILAAQESRVERLEAQGDVEARIDKRTVRGATLSYRAADETYVVKGTPAMPLIADGECKTTRAGRTLTYARSTDTMDIDGQKETRTKTSNPCR